MLKIVAAVRRRPGMTHAEFADYIINVHGKLARDNPLRLQRYVQNHVYDGAFGSHTHETYAGLFHRDSVTELHFASPEDMAATFADEYNRTVIAPDGANFAELATNEAVLTRETVLIAPISETPVTKIMHFLVAAVPSGIDAAQAGWQAAHTTALAAAPDFARALQGLARSDVLPASPGSAMDDHFGGSDRPPLALVASLWVPDNGVGAFRTYEAAISASGLYDRELSYFLFTRDIEILIVPA